MLSSTAIIQLKYSHYQSIFRAASVRLGCVWNALRELTGIKSLSSNAELKYAESAIYALMNEAARKVSLVHSFALDAESQERINMIFHQIIVDLFFIKRNLNLEDIVSQAKSWLSARIADGSYTDFEARNEFHLVMQYVRIVESNLADAMKACYKIFSPPPTSFAPQQDEPSNVKKRGESSLEYDPDEAENIDQPKLNRPR